MYSSLTLHVEDKIHWVSDGLVTSHKRRKAAKLDFGNNDSSVVVVVGLGGNGSNTPSMSKKITAFFVIHTPTHKKMTNRLPSMTGLCLGLPKDSIGVSCLLGVVLVAA